MSEPLLPAYGDSTLADVLPSVGAHLGIPGAENRLGLPEAKRWVVFLVDGLGWDLLQRSLAHVPYLADLARRGGAITSGVPSTTATSITSLGTGLPPGQHGMAGYSFRDPSTGAPMNALYWDTDLVPEHFQTRPTYLERARAAGVRVGSVVPARFEKTGLTRAALRGPDFHGVHDESDLERRVELVTAAAVAGERTLVYTYERELDHTGHSRGCGSPQWQAHLRQVDELCELLREALPEDVALLITGDHGMVDVPQERQIIVEDHPNLLADVATFAGEGRMRQLWAEPGRSSVLARRWADFLGDRAWVRTRDEAIDEGWFGVMDDALTERFGDVLVAMREDWAVMTRTLERELGLVGQHGSLTSAEMTVPMLVDAGGASWPS